MSTYYKFTSLEHLQSAIQYGAFASPLTNLNDPYEFEGIRYKDKYRICCLSKVPFKMLMWAHYSKHIGCRIDFKFGDEFDSRLKPVTYEECYRNRAELDESSIEESFYHKGREWAYEEEVRAIWTRGSTSACWKKDFEGNVFLAGRVSSITFGLLADQDKDAYRKALETIKRHNDQNPNNPISVSKCRLMNSKYQLANDGQFNYLEELKALTQN